MMRPHTQSVGNTTSAAQSGGVASGSYMGMQQKQHQPPSSSSTANDTAAAAHMQQQQQQPQAQRPQSSPQHTYNTVSGNMTSGGAAAAATSGNGGSGSMSNNSSDSWSGSRMSGSGNNNSSATSASVSGGAYAAPGGGYGAGMSGAYGVGGMPSMQQQQQQQQQQQPPKVGHGSGGGNAPPPQMMSLPQQQQQGGGDASGEYAAMSQQSSAPHRSPYPPGANNNTTRRMPTPGPASMTPLSLPSPQPSQAAAAATTQQVASCTSSRTQTLSSSYYPQSVPASPHSAMGYATSNNSNSNNSSVHHVHGSAPPPPPPPHMEPSPSFAPSTQSGLRGEGSGVYGGDGTAHTVSPAPPTPQQQQQQPQQIQQGNMSAPAAVGGGGHYRTSSGAMPMQSVYGGSYGGGGGYGGGMQQQQHAPPMMMAGGGSGNRGVMGGGHGLSGSMGSMGGYNMGGAHNGGNGGGNNNSNMMMMPLQQMGGGGGGMYGGGGAGSYMAPPPPSHMMPPSTAMMQQQQQSPYHNHPSPPQQQPYPGGGGRMQGGGGGGSMGMMMMSNVAGGAGMEWGGMQQQPSQQQPSPMSMGGGGMTYGGAAGGNMSASPMAMGGGGRMGGGHGMKGMHMGAAGGAGAAVGGGGGAGMMNMMSMPMMPPPPPPHQQSQQSPLVQGPPLPQQQQSQQQLPPPGTMMPPTQQARSGVGGNMILNRPPPLSLHMQQQQQQQQQQQMMMMPQQQQQQQPQHIPPPTHHQHMHAHTIQPQQQSPSMASPPHMTQSQPTSMSHLLPHNTTMPLSPSQQQQQQQSQQLGASGGMMHGPLMSTQSRPPPPPLRLQPPSTDNQGMMLGSQATTPVIVGSGGSNGSGSGGRSRGGNNNSNAPLAGVGGGYTGTATTGIAPLSPMGALSDTANSSSMLVGSSASIGGGVGGEQEGYNNNSSFVTQQQQQQQNNNSGSNFAAATAAGGSVDAAAEQSYVDELAPELFESLYEFLKKRGLLHAGTLRDVLPAAAAAASSSARDTATRLHSPLIVMAIDGNYMINQLRAKLQQHDPLWFLHSWLPDQLLELVREHVCELRRKSIEPVWVFNGIGISGDVETFLPSREELLARNEVWQKLTEGELPSADEVAVAFDTSPSIGEDVYMAVQRFLRRELGVLAVTAPFLNWCQMATLHHEGDAQLLLGPPEMLLVPYENMRLLVEVDPVSEQVAYFDRDEVLRDLFPHFVRGNNYSAASDRLLDFGLLIASHTAITAARATISLTTAQVHEELALKQPRFASLRELISHYEVVHMQDRNRQGSEALKHAKGRTYIQYSIVFSRTCSDGPLVYFKRVLHPRLTNANMPLNLSGVLGNLVPLSLFYFQYVGLLSVGLMTILTQSYFRDEMPVSDSADYHRHLAMFSHLRRQIICQIVLKINSSTYHNHMEHISWVRWFDNILATLPQPRILIKLDEWRLSELPELAAYDDHSLHRITIAAIMAMTMHVPAVAEHAVPPSKTTMMATRPRVEGGSDGVYNNGTRGERPQQQQQQQSSSSLSGVLYHGKKETFVAIVIKCLDFLGYFCPRTQDDGGDEGAGDNGDYDDNAPPYSRQQQQQQQQQRQQQQQDMYMAEADMQLSSDAVEQGMYGMASNGQPLPPSASSAMSSYYDGTSLQQAQHAGMRGIDSGDVRSGSNVDEQQQQQQQRSASMDSGNDGAEYGNYASKGTCYPIYCLSHSLLHCPTAFHCGLIRLTELLRIEAMTALPCEYVNPGMAADEYDMQQQQQQQGQMIQQQLSQSLPQQSDVNEVPEVLLATRIACLISLPYKPPMDGTPFEWAPVYSRHLCAFSVMVRVMNRHLRELVEVLTASTFLLGYSDCDMSEYADIIHLLPFDDAPSSIGGLLLHYVLVFPADYENDCNTPQERCAYLQSKFKSIPDVTKQLRHIMEFTFQALFLINAYREHVPPAVSSTSISGTTVIYDTLTLLHEKWTLHLDGPAPEDVHKLWRP